MIGTSERENSFEDILNTGVGSDLASTEGYTQEYGLKYDDDYDDDYDEEYDEELFVNSKWRLVEIPRDPYLLPLSTVR